MWVLLSSRLRTWALLAVGVPAARQAIRYAAKRGDDNSSSAKALRRADSVLARIDRREKKRARADDAR